MESLNIIDILFIPEFLLLALIIVLSFWGDKFLRFLRRRTNVIKNSKLKTIPLSDEENIIDKIKDKRDEIYQHIHEVSKELDIQIECERSVSLDTTAWIECNVPNYVEVTKSKESNLILILESFPFYKYDILVSIELTFGGNIYTFENIMNFHKEDVLEILKIMSSWSYEMNYNPESLTSNRWLFWKEKNRLNDKYKKTVWYASYGIHQYKVTMGKPLNEPRQLTQLDSWQTVIMGIGNEKNQLLNEIENKLSNLKIQKENFQIKKEKISYWNIQGKEGREQLVCIFNRAYIFIHIYEYGDDLYIGWDANLNYATWEEYKVADGYTKGRVKNIELCSIRATWKEVNEYDLNDARFILEVVHSNIRQILKRIIKEKEIDQEIDFSIVRESRNDALKTEKPKENKKKSKFKRLS